MPVKRPHVPTQMFRIATPALVCRTRMRWSVMHCCDRPDFTYVIESLGLYKIGSAKDIAKRLMYLRIGSASELNYIAHCRGREMERVLHKACAVYRHHGEWFSAPAWDLIRPLFTQHRCAACLVLSRCPAPTNALETVSVVVNALRVDPAAPVRSRLATSSPYPRPLPTSISRSKTRVAIGSRGRRIIVHK